MPQRSASTLDEETALAVALSISKEDSHSSHPSTKDAAGIIGRGKFHHNLTPLLTLAGDFLSIESCSVCIFFDLHSLAGERSADIETGEQPLADASASTGLDESTGNITALLLLKILSVQPSRCQERLKAAKPAQC